jgi:uncharacterized membrane protein YpjA
MHKISIFHKTYAVSGKTYAAYSLLMAVAVGLLIAWGIWFLYLTLLTINTYTGVPSWASAIVLIFALGTLTVNKKEYGRLLPPWGAVVLTVCLVGGTLANQYFVVGASHTQMAMLAGPILLRIFNWSYRRFHAIPESPASLR